MLINLKEYLTLFDRTECDYGAVSERCCSDKKILRLAHHALGVVSEFSELMEAKSAEEVVGELGDMMYFCSGAASTIGFDLESITLKEGEDPSLLNGLKCAGNLAGAAKSPLAYGRALNEQEVIDSLVGVVRFLLATCQAMGIPMEKIYTANIEKLKRRFPDQYSDFHANNRDTDKEFEAISEVIVVQQ